MTPNAARQMLLRRRWPLVALMAATLALVGPGLEGAITADTGATTPISAGIFAGPCDDLAAEPAVVLTEIAPPSGGAVASSLTVLTTDGDEFTGDGQAVALRQGETEIACGAIGGGPSQIGERTLVVGLRGGATGELRGAAFFQRVAEQQIQVTVMLDPQRISAPSADAAGNPTVPPTPISITVEFSLVGTAPATQPAAVVAPAVSVAGACDGLDGQAVASVTSVNGSLTGTTGQVGTAVVSATVPGALADVASARGSLVITPGGGWAEGPVCGSLVADDDDDAADRLIVPLLTVARGQFVGVCFVEPDARGGVIFQAFLTPMLAAAEQPAALTASDEGDDEDDGGKKDGKDGKDKKNDDDHDGNDD